MLNTHSSARGDGSGADVAGTEGSEEEVPRIQCPGEDGEDWKILVKLGGWFGRDFFFFFQSFFFVRLELHSSGCEGFFARYPKVKGTIFRSKQ